MQPIVIKSTIGPAGEKVSIIDTNILLKILERCGIEYKVEETPSTKKRTRKSPSDSTPRSHKTPRMEVVSQHNENDVSMNEVTEVPQETSAATPSQVNEENIDEDGPWTKVTHSKKPRIPPVIAENVTDWKLLCQELKDLRTDKFQCTISGNKHIIKAKNISDLKKNQGILVLKGVTTAYKTEDIAIELATMGFTETSVKRLHRQSTKRPMNIVLVELPKNEHNNKFYGITELLYQKIAVESFRTTNLVTQCFNCQGFGHGQLNCFLNPKCVKCAEEHHSKDCPRRSRQLPPKCANCEEAQTANYRGCPKFPRVHQQQPRYPGQYKPNNPIPFSKRSETLPKIVEQQNKSNAEVATRKTSHSETKDLCEKLMQVIKTYLQNAFEIAKMKIDRTKLKKSSSEVPADCKALIDKLKSCSQDELHLILKDIKSWNCGKCELFHWIDVLDIFDGILEAACQKSKWCLLCDMAGNEARKELLLEVLHFTALLIEHSFSRHFYNSMEHLTSLLGSSDMQVVLAVLNLLYVFRGKHHQHFWSGAGLTHFCFQSWGGRENGFGLAECCQNLPITSFPSSATTLHFEFYSENGESSAKKANTICTIHVENLDQIPDKTPSQIMEELLVTFPVPEAKQMCLFTHIRLAHSFSDYTKRLQCVQARLQALSILVYCNSIQDNANLLLYAGLIEELVDVLELPLNNLIDIKAASLRTLTSIIHLDRNPKLGFRLSAIIDATGAAFYHGFLPVLVRSCILSLTSKSFPPSDAPGEITCFAAPDSLVKPFALPFATALFSFLYHLASYESGGEALVACGMMEALLKIIVWHGMEPENITVRLVISLSGDWLTPGLLQFVTRAVRVIDLITNLDMQAFQSHSGLNCFISRLEFEINVCRKDQPYVIRVGNNRTRSTSESNFPVAMEIDGSFTQSISDSTDSSHHDDEGTHEAAEPRKGVQCFPQRAALLKSMLNFLKKAIQDPAFSDNIRHLMDGSLPKSLKHIISNAEYYGPSLFLLAMDVVTVYVFQEPSLLSCLQDNGLTDVMLHAILEKEVPATREVLAGLPNVFSALCLNARGLQAFTELAPFQKVFRVLISPEYLGAMRRRRTSDPMGDTASNLGNAMDELMRHQPSLRADAMGAIIKLLEELATMGRDPKYVCSRPPATASKQDPPSNSPGSGGNNVPNDGNSSDDEDDDEDEAGVHPVQGADIKTDADKALLDASGSEAKTPIPLVDYILNVMRFVDAILSNNSTDDHCREFVRQKGLIALMNLLGLPNLPIDFPVTPTCQAVASVCKSILNLAHEPLVLRFGLLQLKEALDGLEPLHQPLGEPGGSVLLEELVNAPSAPGEATASAQATPLLHAMASAHSYIVMFVHVCRSGQSEIRTISTSQWGSELGLSVLKQLSHLYTSLVWESTILLALCSENTLPAGCQFGRHQLEKLVNHSGGDTSLVSAIDDCSTESAIGDFEVTTAMQALSTNGNAMEVDEPNGGSDKPKSAQIQSQIKQIKPLLSGASRLGRALAELFGLLVKLCVGSPIRQRRGQQIPPAPPVPTPAAREVASALTQLLAAGLSWEPPPTSPLPKFRLTFYVCSVGFTSPMLFDDRKFPYYLMLHNFITTGGQQAFFDTFQWALTIGGKVAIDQGLEHPDLPDGTGEFLDAWLGLLEKMVNPKTILESPHTFPQKNSQTSNDPIHYLINTHKLAFDAIMHLWDRKPLKIYGDRMSETMLAILCHILKGEALIHEKLFKEKEGGGESSKARGSAKKLTETTPAPAANSESEVNAAHLQQLMDMGFCRDMATEALRQTSSLEQATDYLLNYSSQLSRSTLPNWSEEDQMMRAIAMSLGENVLTSGEEATSSSGGAEKKSPPAQEKFAFNTKPIPPQEIDTFTQNILSGCLRLLDTLPECVYRTCDLLVVVASRNGTEWRDKMLVSLLDEIEETVVSLFRSYTLHTVEPEQWLELPEASKAAVRIHLFTLLFEEMRLACATLVEARGLMQPLVRLLDSLANCLLQVSNPTQPKYVNLALAFPILFNILVVSRWLASVILLIDLYEKASVATKRRVPLLQVPKRQWKWFDDRSSRWNSYTTANNKAIDDAYKAGEQSVRFTAGRRRYTAQFSTMIQVNEETGNWRPIMLVVENDEKKEDNRVKEKVMEMDESSQDAASTSRASAPPEMHTIEGLTSDQVQELVHVCVTLISIPVDNLALNAAMRLCLRLTCVHENAILFAELGGIKHLLCLTQASSFWGFASLATLLIRHVLEEPPTLRHAMEKVVRSSTAGSSTPLSSKELHYVLRVLAPAACRNPDIFLEVAKNTLRISLLPLSKREEEERYANTNSIQMLKSLPAKSTQNPVFEGPLRGVIYDLLNALTIKTPLVAEETPDQALPISDRDSLQETNSNDILPQDDDVVDVGVPHLNGSSEASTSKDGNKGNKDGAKDAKNEEAKKNAPLIPKSAICRLLAELVRSYAGAAKLIAEHMFLAGQSELVPEDCTAMSFILDNLLSNWESTTPALTRVLVAALASSNHSPETQAALVNEIKLALHRALSLPESSEKHSRVQALAGLLSTTIESCPPLIGSASSFQRGNNSGGMNSIVRLLLRRGLVGDLARVPHHLDLASPHMAATVNAALKPLETLSKIVNIPPANQMGPRSAGQRKASTSGGASSGQRADLMEEDTQHDSGENTDSEAPNAPNSNNDLVLMSSQNREISEAVEVQLESIMDQLLDGQFPSGRSAEEELQALITVEGGAGGAAARNSEPSLVINLDTEADHRDSESHAAADDRHESTDSDSDESEEAEEDEAAQEDDEREDEGDDEAEEEEEEEEEDDEGSHYEFADGFQDIGEALFGMQDQEDYVYFRISDSFPMRGADGIRTIQIPALADEANSDENSPPSVIPPAPGFLTSSHPLLLRRGCGEGAGTGAGHSRGLHRSARQRCYRQSHFGNHSWHIYATSAGAGNNATGANAGAGTTANNVPGGASTTTRHPNTPAILQRLLGPSSAQDLLQFSSFSSQNSEPRILFANIATEDDLLDFQDQNSLLADGNSSCILSSIPSALVRWTEESRILDGDSVHDCVTSIKPSLIEVLEKFRNEEWEERREKRKKAQQQEEASQPAEADKPEVGETPPAATSGAQASSLFEEMGTQASLIPVISPMEISDWVAHDSPQPPDTVESPQPPPTGAANTEQLAASIVAQVLGPAMALTSQPPQQEATSEVSQELASLEEQQPPTVLSPSSTMDSEPAQVATPEDPPSGAVTWESTEPVQSSSSDYSSVLGDVDLPEGVDPSFLAALPENIRQEVIAEQFRLQRIRTRASNPVAESAAVAAPGSSSSSSTAAFTEVNPEFLAALPPNIQEEVLAQQRAEQQRLAAQNSNPDTPVDPAGFIQTLPAGLRQQVSSTHALVLSDIDDSLIALLPQELATEAQSLRREMEARHRQMQERFLSSQAGTALSRILRSAGRLGGRSSNANAGTNLPATQLSNLLMKRGRQLLDHEGLSCLLVLLFVDEPKLNTARLHRVLRNLCYHTPTRQWVICSLLSILERTKESRMLENGQPPGDIHKGKKNSPKTPDTIHRLEKGTTTPSWLSIGLDAALGCRTSVFQIHRQGSSKRHPPLTYPMVTIHPQASPIVFRHVLDTLILFAKNFPVHFLPDKLIEEKYGKDAVMDSKQTLKPVVPTTPKSDLKSAAGSSSGAQCSTNVGASTSTTRQVDTDFWDVLVKLDCLSTSRKGKGAYKSHNPVLSTSTGSLYGETTEEELKLNGFEQSPMAQLMSMLSHPVVHCSSQLTDRLLRLLALISVALPDQETRGEAPASEEPAAEKTAVVPARDEKEENKIIKQHLRLAVEVLTSKTCSEEGLEDATSLLLRLSRGCGSTRQSVLQLLLEGARELGNTVCQHIRVLIGELHVLNAKLANDRPGNSSIVLIGPSPADDDSDEAAGRRGTKGTIADRFTSSTVVITAPSTRGVKGSELQLPSMATLTSKTSSQAFFLRILKVIIQLRDSSKSRKPSARLSSHPPVVAAAVAAVVGPDVSTPMDIDSGSGTADLLFKEVLTPLSSELDLDTLWETLSECLVELAETPDHHAVLVLQPAVEAFFLVHAAPSEQHRTRHRSSQENQLSHIEEHDSGSLLSILPPLNSDTHKFLKFAEKHKTVLNQILRQSTTPLVDGPFAVLVDHTRVLDFDVKRRYFRQELERMDEGARREDLAVHVRREHIFEDSFRELHRRVSEDWKNRFYIVFEGEEGQDAGGLLREWYTIISREIFNPMYALFTISPGDRVTYMINPSSHCNSNHLSYFKFVGRVIAKAIYDNKLLECYFTRSFYKHILGKPVKYTDMESEDYSFYQGLVFLLDHGVRELGYELTFSVEMQEFGVTEIRDLIPNGRNELVTEENKHEYVKLVCQEKMTGAIRKQLNAFLEGFYEIIPKRLISIFNEQELELLISGLPNIDIDDLKANSEYHKYQQNSLQIQWFWRALRSFDQADRAKFLQFVTGTSKVPLQGFSALEGMNGIQKFQIHRDDRSTDRLPSAHTCFNQLDLPAYETYDKLRSMLLKAIHECSEGFGFA
ncbi:HUWE1 [Cordylochernes scorpioides]|uniref:HECT-type E3 ubiquitin transferase n=1 Tax=Cordylochernes scorpioides TaxID=51811 RepID=A0ABY6LGM1_9ARAC|nr:HUWE1 [Cordylochernes scorpioides]